jgi:hypothetical protein
MDLGAMLVMIEIMLMCFGDGDHAHVLWRWISKA